jgi:hypothetical protein
VFNKVWHIELLYRLSLPLNYFLVLKSYLHIRYFLVKVETEDTELSPVNAGIPQGSVLAAVQNWFKECRIEASDPSFYFSFTTQTEMCPPLLPSP